MTPAEKALRTVRSQTLFEMAEVAHTVSAAVRRAQEADAHRQASDDRQRETVRSMRQAQQRAVFNPALRSTLRVEYDIAFRSGQAWTATLNEALRAEAQARSLLAQLRHRDSGLTRSISQERRKQLALQQRTGYVQADEFWLHKTRGAR